MEDWADVTAWDCRVNEEPPPLPRAQAALQPLPFPGSRPPCGHTPAGPGLDLAPLPGCRPSPALSQAPPPRAQ